MNAEPLVMCLTNYVAAEFTANVLLAIGAKPAMVEEPSEAAELTSKADAVLINLGTVHPRQLDAIRSTLTALGTDPCPTGTVPRTMGTVPNCSSTLPWVLDPVGCHLLSYRGRIAAELISQKPTLIRGNHAEIDYLMGTVPLEMGTVPAILSTGEVDRIYTPNIEDRGSGAFRQPRMEISGGVSMLQTVTATGCVQGAVCAAMLGRGLSPVEAAETASRLMKRAGELAFSRTKLPGSFKIALIDALYELSKSEI